jgi:hypothetical protein
MSLALYLSRVRSSDLLGVITALQADVSRVGIVAQRTLNIVKKSVCELQLFGLSEHAQKPASFRESESLPRIVSVVAVRASHVQAKPRILHLNKAPEVLCYASLHTPPKGRELSGQPLC